MSKDTESEYGIGELFECQICMDPLLDKQPRTLSCNHTYCQECLEQLVRFGSIKCPNCRVTTQIPTGGVKKLPLNFELAKMKEREMDIAKKFSIMCQICLRKHEHTKAQFKCIQCFQTMCKPCRVKHDKVAIFKAHTVEEVSSSQQVSNVCPSHHQNISYICQKCLKGICMDCLLEDEHADHQDKVEDLATGIKSVRSSIADISKVLKECQERLNVKITGINKDLEQTTAMKETVNNRKRELDNQIGKEFQKLITSVKTRYENPMVASLDNIRSTLGRVQSAVDMCKRVGSDDDLELIARLPNLKTLTSDLLKLAQDQFKTLYAKPKFNPRQTLGATLLGNVESCEAGADNITYVAVPLKEPAMLLHFKQQDGRIKIRSPMQVLCLEDGGVLLADSDVSYVQRININGVLVAKYYPQEDGEKIHSITMVNGDLYIAQEKSISVVPCVCSSSASGPPVIKHGTKSRDNISITKSGIIYHAQFSNGRILQVDKDGESREVLGGVTRPAFISVAYTDQGIRYIITEYFAHRISIFDEEWDKVTHFGKQGSNDGCLWCPLATAVSAGDTILVADSVNNRISQFSLRGKFLRHILDHTHDLDSPTGLGYKHPYLWVSECRTPGHTAIKLFQLAD